jgi:hypothetical protein
LAYFENSRQGDEQDNSLAPSGATCRHQERGDDRIGDAMLKRFRKSNRRTQAAGNSDRTTIANNPRQPAMEVGRQSQANTFAGLTAPNT